MSRKKRTLTDEEKNKIMKAKQELTEYRENMKYIEERLNDTEEIKNRVEKVTTTFSLTKNNNIDRNFDKFGEAIGRLEELKILCTEKMKELLLKKFKIDDKIELLVQPYRNVLFYRYTRGKAWKDVADELGYKEDYIYELHGEALYLYSKI